ncbi:hypothetical protein I8751_19930 [Nostocaceae cyanobacterium CENA357]|uniref:Uncharacterized protein n=1 Tax=Atlanticothrix silvestris CENA357 TaxID=1725252 RepID=A0A8J7L444_9CYAN|nr:hypothetical protein [Atlanticothrix silvestris]MBH8554589.1 hypothetical protein [Atlanticothrix silvestris CENA357]
MIDQRSQLGNLFLEDSDRILHPKPQEKPHAQARITSQIPQPPQQP